MLERIKNYRGFVIGISIFVFLLIAFMIFFCKYIYPNYYKITSFKVKQDALDLNISWKCKKTESFEVKVYKGDDLVKKVDVKNNAYIYPLDEVEVGYTVKVEPNRPLSFIADKKKTVDTHKLEQKISMYEYSYDGFVGDTFSIYAMADSKVTFIPSDDASVMVTRLGNVKIMAPGEYDIDVVAKENEFYKEASDSFHIKAYPDKLDKPTVSVGDTSGLDVKLSWKEVENASDYIVMKYNYWTKDYEKYATVSASDALEIVVPNSDSMYKVRAKGKILDRNVSSSYSEEVSIKPPADAAATYSEYHVLDKLTLDKLNLIASISGPSGTTCPQSFSYTGKGYLVAFANNAGNKTALVEFDSTGKKIRSQFVKMGHANGSSYNPRNNVIYTLKRHGNIKSDTCITFNYDDFSSNGNFELPDIVLGMSYDVTTDKFYYTNGARVGIMNSDFKVEKSFTRVGYKNHTQDCGAGDGVCVLTSWNSGDDSYVDLYRMSDGGYLGTYKVPIGEIESATIVDKHLVLLMNNAEKYGDCILQMKDKINL